ncbi:MAG: (2Fe-2S) ferredoxin domain-containing protein, partial [Victivallales bacterium]|nr:(2Fe-2S) ferredoxin domain-containing protein [Victivallales bacterium]
MKKITSKADLMAMYDAAKGRLALRLAGAKTDSKKKDILICGDTGCLVSNSQDIIANLRAEVKAAGLENDVNVIQTGCFGFCAQGPIVKIMPDNVFYVKVTPEDAKEIVQKHIVEHKLVDRLVYVEPTLKAQIT